MCMMSYKSVLIVIYKTLLSLMGVIMFYGCSSTTKQYCYEMNNGIVVKSVIICTDKKQIERSTFKRIN